jgi:Protein of unknown function (DUF2281)
MPTKQVLLQAIDQMPDILVEEVLDFVQFLQQKHAEQKLAVSILSESALAKDWLKPEEDEAWQDL